MQVPKRVISHSGALSEFRVLQGVSNSATKSCINGTGLS